MITLFEEENCHFHWQRAHCITRLRCFQCFKNLSLCEQQQVNPSHIHFGK